MLYLLSHLIDQSAERFPERESFRIQGTALTFAEMSRRTSQLANVLVREGVRRGDRVGIFMNKSLEMPVAVHGIMKAGGVYVPIDPAAPPARVRFIIQNCGIRLLIADKTKTKLLKGLVDRTDLRCIIGLSPDADLEVGRIPWADVLNASSSAPVQGPVTEQDLAYIMYTSGSTGEPKGIMHTHSSGLNYARLAAQTYDFSSADRFGNHSPLHFDMSTLEFFSAPLVGGCTVLIPEAYTKIPASLSQLIENEQLTIWYSVPFALIQLLLRGAMETRNLSTLRWILFGGEPFPTKHLRELMQRLPQARFSNVYGPAEVNQCSYYHVPKLCPESEGFIPIGKLWQNCEGLVVDEADRPVEDGEQGELLVKTPTMMQGYWSRSDLNEGAFFYRSHPSTFHEKFYRTGDLVRLNDDKEYLYIGRKDRQIKTRGYRVELDEVEAALLSHADVDEAAAFAFAGSEGSFLIGACVIVNQGEEAGDVSELELLRYLKSRLPLYALPKFIKLQHSFVRTTSGKIDRRALSETQWEL